MAKSHRSQNDQRSDAKNPTSREYKTNMDNKSNQSNPISSASENTRNNRSNQMNPNNNSFKGPQISEPQQVNNRLATRVSAEVIRKKQEENKPKICYVCGIELLEFYKTDMNKQDGLNSPPIIPQMTKWNGVKVVVCPDCYKAAETGLNVFMENNPTWKRP